MKVKIIREVYSKKQRKFFCASDDPELKSMCDDPMKEDEQLEEISGAGAVAGAVGARGGPWATERDEIERENEKAKPIEEMYSTQGTFQTGMELSGDAFAGFSERSAHQGLKNVPTPKKRMKIRIRRRIKETDENTFSLDGSDLESIGGGDQTGVSQGHESNEDSYTNKALLSFATKARNQKHLKVIINQIFESYKFDQLWKAIITDNSSKERINFMSKNIPDVSSNLYKEILKGNESAIKDYYNFIAVEYLYWTLTNPRAHPSRKGVGIFEMTDEIRSYVMAHIDRYAHPKYGKSSKNNPKSLSQSTIGPDSPSQKDYGEKGGLDPLLYKLPE